MNSLIKFISKNKGYFLVLAIFALELFLRFYQIEQRNPFGWDQVDNAWAAKNFIVNHQWPLVGMVAKGNSGFYIGPLYYYLISIVYWFTNLNPIASGIFAGLTSIFTFCVLFFVTQKLFSFRVAVIAVFIQTVAFSAIIFDRVQWPVDFIPAVSYLIFYFLYQIISGKPKYIPWLALTVGLAFHIHFTAVFFPIIIVLTLPFWPRKKETLIYFLIAIPILILCFLPSLIYELQHKSSQTSHLTNYLSIYYHGFHLHRVMQIMGDGFIQFEPFLFEQIKLLKYILLPLFIIIYVWKEYKKSPKKLQDTKNKVVEFTKNNLNTLLLSYVMMLYFIIPWFVFATYKGEITDYYFSINRFIAVVIIAYLLAKLFEVRLKIVKILVILFLVFYGSANISRYFNAHDVGLSQEEPKIQSEIQQGQIIQYTEGVPDSYLYWYYMWKRGKNVY